MTTKTDISKITFSSTVFPSAEDKQLWASLTDDEREAVLIRWEEEGFQSGKADPISVDEWHSRITANARLHALQS